MRVALATHDGCLKSLVRELCADDGHVLSEIDAQGHGDGGKTSDTKDQTSDADLFVVHMACPAAARALQRARTCSAAAVLAFVDANAVDGGPTGASMLSNSTRSTSTTSNSPRGASGAPRGAPDGAALDVLEAGATAVVPWPTSRTVVAMQLRLAARAVSSRAPRLHPATDLGTLMDSTFVGFWQIDTEGNTVYVNAAMVRMLEADDPRQLRGKPYRPFFTEASLRTMAVEHARRAHGIASTYEVELVGLRGTRRRALISGAPVRSPEGELVGLVGTFVDVSERRAIESRLVAADRLASMGRLAAGMAHEINNPLTYMLVNLGILADSLGNAPQVQAPSSPLPANKVLDVDLARQLVAECREGAERVRTLVHDLRTLARGDVETVEPVDLVALVHAACNVMANELRLRARLVKHLAPIPRVSGNPSRLGQVITNLLANALESIPTGAPDRNEICVRTRTGPGRDVVLEVEDTGVGIPEDIQDRIFEPFFTTKPVGVGSGLGLAICHGVVDALGGSIEVESRREKGSRFRVRLPAMLPDSAPPSRPSESSDAKSPRILVVDDEPTVGMSIARVLRGLGQVVVEHDAKRAVERLRSGERFDAILCDLMMPEMSGMDLQRVLESTFPDLSRRTVFMTGGAFTPQARAFVDAMPERHIDKPFDVERLRTLVLAIVTDGAAPSRLP